MLNKTRTVLAHGGTREDERAVAVWAGGAPGTAPRVYESVTFASQVRLWAAANRGVATGVLGVTKMGVVGTFVYKLTEEQREARR